MPEEKTSLLLKLKFDPLPRAAGISDRLVAILFAARFTDELLSGLPAVLMPSIRSYLGLSYTQVSLLGLALDYTAAIVEPINGLLIDIWKRPWLMAFGAAGIGIGTMVMGLAPTLVIMILGFVIYGLASGPLAHTADVVLVESYPETPDRIYSRSTLLDTFGAVLAPLLVSVSFLIGMDWHWLMILLGLSGIFYAVFILRTHFPSRKHGDHRSDDRIVDQLRINLKEVLSSRSAMRWLLYLLIFAFLEAPMNFETIWLREQVGMSQGLIGLYRAVELGVSMISLVALDRWLARSNYRRIVLMASFGLFLLYPLWLFAGGIIARFALAIPISFLVTVYWPIGKAQSLVSVPGKGGTVTAVQSLLGLIPLPLFFGMLAEIVTLTTAMFAIYLSGTLLMMVLVWRMPE